MARTSTETKSKKAPSRAVIAKIAEEAGKKAAKKVASKIAHDEASKTATRVATRAALDPDYTSNTDIEEDDQDYNPRYGRVNYLETEEEEEEDEDNDSGFTLNQYGQQSGSDDLSDNPRSTDIFSYGTELLNKGTPIRFQIKKNGQFLTTVREPYSEDRLQKDHGEGHYAVILRNDAKGTFIKQQSFSVAAPTVKHEEIVKAKTDEKLDRMFETFGQMQERTQDTQAQLFDRIMEEQRRREDEEKERRREERDSMRQQEQQNQNLLATVLQASLSNKKDDGGGNMALLQMMQAQQQQTANLIMESNKNFMTMIQEMRRDTSTMIDKMSESQKDQAREFRNQIEKMAGSKKEGFDAVEMFKMLNDTRESGMQFGLQINALAKELSDAGESEKEPKGLTETIIENLGKLAPLMLAAGQNQGQAPAQQYFEPQQQQLVNAPAAPSYKKASAAPVRHAQPQTVVAQPVAQQNAPQAQTDAQRVAKKVVAKASVARSSETATIDANTSVKKTVVDICASLIGHALMNNVSSGDLGDATIKALAEKNISTSKALELLSLDDIYHLSFTVYTLPDVPELRVYLKDYHDYLKAKASITQSR
jgi:hypothetical protein